MEKKYIHPEIEAIIDGSLDVGVTTPWDSYIGRKVFLLNKDNIVEKYSYDRETKIFDDNGPEIFTIKRIQKMEDGSLGFRVYAPNDDFGRPTSPKDVIYINNYEAEACILFGIPYRPSKNSPLKIQSCRVYVYPTHHTLNNDFIDQFGINTKPTERYLALLEKNNQPIFIDFLRSEIPSPSYFDHRGSDADDDPFIIRGRKIRTLDLRYEFSGAHWLLKFPKPITPEPKLTSLHKETLLSWFRPAIQSVLNEKNREWLYRAERKRYITETLAKITGAIRSFQKFSDELLTK